PRNAIDSAQTADTVNVITGYGAVRPPRVTATPMPSPAMAGSAGCGRTPAANSGIPAHHAPRTAAPVQSGVPNSTATASVTATPIAALTARAGWAALGSQVSRERPARLAGSAMITPRAYSLSH